MFSEVSHRQSGIEKGKESLLFFMCRNNYHLHGRRRRDGESEIKAGVLMFGHSGNNMVKMSSSQVLLG